MIQKNEKKTKSSIFKTLNFHSLSSYIISFVTVCVGVLISLYLFFYSQLARSDLFPFYTILYVLLISLLWIIIPFIAFFISKTKEEWLIIKKSLSILFIMSILSTYLISIMERHLSTIFNSPTNSISIYSYIVVPLVEEFSKFFPVVILSKHFIRIDNQSSIYPNSLVSSSRQIVLLAMFFGSFFGLFEHLFLYSSILSSDLLKPLIFQRTVFPLHAVTSGFFAIGYAFYFKNRGRLKKENKLWLTIFPVVISFFIHSYWNYSSLNNNINTLRILGFISIVFYVLFVAWIIFSKPKLCSNCKTEHIAETCPMNPLYDVELEQITEKESIFKEEYNIQDNFVECPKCGIQLFDGKVCYGCQSFPKLQCKNCNQVVPAFSRHCWSCGTTLPSLYDKMRSSSPAFYITFSVALTRFLSVGILVSTVLALRNISNTSVYLGFTVLLLSLLISFFVIVFWFSIDNKKTSSMIISVVVTSSVVLTVIANSFLYIIISIIVLINSFISGIVGLLSSLLLISLGTYYLNLVMKGEGIIIGENTNE